MSANKFILLLLLSFGMAIQVASAAAIPAGTILVLKTTNTISSRDNMGKQFQGQLVQSVGVKESVALRAGTKVVGIVQSPRVAIGSSGRPLTLRLTQVSVHGRMVPIKTQDFEVENAGITGRRGTRFTGGAFLLPPGTVLQFRLAQPLTL